MVRRKQYRTVIYIVGVFVALLTFSNVLLNTLSRENVITTNLNIGADVNANVMEGSLYASNSSEITLWEQNITAFRLHDDQVLFNDVLTCYVESSQDESRGYSSEFYYLNLEKYLDITSEGEKFVPSQSYERNLEYVIDYNNDPSSTLPGIIVNQRYCDYNQKIIGDTIQINHSYFNSSNNEVSSVVLDAKIIAVLDMVPGIYQSEKYWSYGKEIIIMDVASLNSDLDLLHGQELIQLLDININVENNETIITSAIRNASADFGYHASIQYYNQDWNEVNIQMDQSEIGFFGIIYLEFIIIGGLMAFGIAILLLSLQRDNKYFNGVLLARGFGKKGILKFVLSQLFIIYFISLITGLVGGFLTSSIFLKVETLSISYLGVEFPIFLNPVELISVLSIITASSFIIYFVAYFFESRKNITQYFHKF